MKWFVLPFRFVAEVLVFAFDILISRYILAAVVIAVFWLPAYLAFGISHKWFLFPTIILGMCLCGLWDGCRIFTIRGRLARLGIVRSWDDLHV